MSNQQFTINKPIYLTAFTTKLLLDDPGAEPMREERGVKLLRRPMKLLGTAKVWEMRGVGEAGDARGEAAWGLEASMEREAEAIGIGGTMTVAFSRLLAGVLCFFLGG